MIYSMIPFGFIWTVYTIIVWNRFFDGTATGDHLVEWFFLSVIFWSAYGVWDTLLEIQKILDRNRKR